MKINRFCFVSCAITLCICVLLVYGEDDNGYATGDSKRSDNSECGEHLLWTLGDDGVLTISGNGTMNDYDHAKKKDPPWFDKRDSIFEVAIDSGVESIGDSAFVLCHYLKKITMPNTLKSIGFNCFYKCFRLSELSIPSSVTSIAGYAFYDCRSLTEVSISANVNSLGPAPFASCQNLIAINVEQGNNNYSSSDGVLFDHSFTTLISFPAGISSYVVPDGVTTLGEGCFEGCASLKKVSLPDSVTTIGSGCFNYCHQLTEISLPANVTKIGMKAFNECKSLVEITIPDKITSIPEATFSYCSSLTKVNIGNGVISIGNDAFSYCTDLVEVTFGNRVASIGQRAFCHCSNLARVVIPDGITSIQGSCFSFCSSLTEVVIPDSVKTIQSYAFYNCTSLNNVIIPFGVSSLGENSFQRCLSLTEVVIPGSVTTIGGYAFSNCEDLTTVIIGSGVSMIVGYAFSSCVSLKSVFYTGSTNLTDETVFSGCTGLDRVYVSSEYNSTVFGGKSVTSAYCGKCGDQFSWALSGSKLRINGKGKMNDCFDAPWGKEGVESVVIDEGLESIGSGIFQGHTHLATIIIPSTVTTIESSSFKGCSSLRNVIIPDSVSSIGDEAFSNCTGIKKMIIPSSVTFLGNYAFENCIGLSEISVGKNVISIGVNTFCNCQSLMQVTLPASLTSVGSEAFKNCKSLTSVFYLGSADNLPSNAFDGCSALTNVYVSPEYSGNVFCGKSITGYYGNCGEESAWLLSGSLFTVIGSGPMTDFETGKAPWNTLKGKIERVLIEKGITSIGAYSFYQCTNLRSFTIPDDVISIGSFAFYACTGLTELTIPEKVESIGEKAFSYCTALTEVTIGSNVSSIGNSAFSGCSSLISVFYNGLTALSTPNVFDFCNALKTVCVPYDYSSEQFCGEKVYKRCGKCGEKMAWTFDEGVLRISGTGEMMNSLSESTDFWSEVKDSVKTIVIEDGVLSIGRNAFGYCSRLNEVLIGESVTSIESGAFSFCPSLTSVFYLGSTVISASDVFDSCDSLSNVCVSPEYNSSFFCGVSVKSKSCSAFLNHCFKPSYDNGKIIPKKKDDALEWELKADDCHEFKCDNESGFITLNLCSEPEQMELWVIVVICLTAFIVVAITVVIILIAFRGKIFKSSRDNDDNGLEIEVNGVSRKLILGKKIGRGSYGTVWLAEAGDLTIAAKEMERYIEDDEKEYKKEMNIMSQLNSKYVVRVYGSTVTESAFFIAMEYVPLGSLSSVLQENKFSSYMRCRFMFDISKGMEYLHEQGIVHRDLKPGNVLVASLDPNSDVLCKITDFGESRKGLEETHTMTMTQGVGSPFYMAPEMIRGDHKYTRAVDIYSFAIVCVELWNEKLPYSEVQFETQFIFANYVVDGHRPEIRDDCPSDLVNLIKSCWAADRVERPPFAAVTKDMNSILEAVRRSTPEDAQHVESRKPKEQAKATKAKRKKSSGRKSKSHNGVEDENVVELDDIV